MQELTPLMEQYHKIKKNHHDEILFFRLGDFYEMFYDDAKVASKILGIALTSRFTGEKRAPMAGIPFHSANTYIARLLKAGLKIAICEQMEKPEDARGDIVERAVVRVITPGTLLEETTLDDKRNNYLVAIYINDTESGIAWVDLSTGKFECVDIKSQKEIIDELTRLAPSECIFTETQVEKYPKLIETIKAATNCMLTQQPDWAFEPQNAIDLLKEHFKVHNLSGFGIDSAYNSIGCAGAILSYLKETLKGPLDHIKRLQYYREENRIFLDRQTILSLELIQTIRDGRFEGTLLSVLDKTLTPMGSRLIREWICSPLKDIDQILSRQQAVSELFDDFNMFRDLQFNLKNIHDLERLTAKVGSNKATPRDLMTLRESLKPLQTIRSILKDAASKMLRDIFDDIASHDQLIALLQKAIVDNPPHLLTEGGIIKKGFDQELDKVLELMQGAKNLLASLEKDEQKKTGIPSLKVGYTQVFGYYIEVTNPYKNKVPSDYMRKQTLKNTERFINARLKDLESQILNAEQRSKAMEYEIFNKVRTLVANEIESIQRSSSALANLDVLCSLAIVARENNYSKPVIDESHQIMIKDGRHPVLEKVLEKKFVQNDCLMDGEEKFIFVITGPNMAGKSTYIRQVALIVLMTQIGSFVPAREARIGAVDRIFTRVGAADELVRGASTFMVEMSETANILNNATDRSLIILDEIGRGTSTFDGVSIAWATCEYIHNKIGARTLFATHYHELIGLEEQLKGVKNLNAKVREWKDEVVFLYKIVDGSTDRSYGIHVAKLAGVPDEVIDRSRIILASLQSLTSSGAKMNDIQLSLFHLVPKVESNKSHPLLEELKAIDIDNMTPLEALKKLCELIASAKKE